MESYYKQFEVIWADIDPNRHMRHTAYNDYAAQARVSIFTECGLSLDEIARMGLGPVLFREETRFFKEVRLFETIQVNCKVRSMRKDVSRWSIIHEIFKENEIKAAEITVDGAWINLKERKIGTPTAELIKTIENFPKTDDFYYSGSKSDT